MLGVFIAFLAGLFISLQNAFNNNLGKVLGPWETVTTVQFVGFAFSVIMVLIFGTKDFSGISNINKIYLLGGIFGVFIVFTVVQSIAMIGTGLAISILVVTQLFFGVLIDHFGLFGIEKLPLNTSKVAGLILMIVGVIVFKINK